MKIVIVGAGAVGVHSLAGASVVAEAPAAVADGCGPGECTQAPEPTAQPQTPC